MIKEIIINESEVEKFVKDIINSAKTQPVNVENALYHHNTKYEYAPFNIRHGLMSVMMLQKYGRVNYTEEQLAAFENDCYNVNGIYCISLSKVGLSDQYSDNDEDYYFDDDTVFYYNAVSKSYSSISSDDNNT